jgi:hypothetical protein
VGRKKLETKLDIVISFRLSPDEVAFGKAALASEYARTRARLPLNGWARAAYVRGAEQTLGITIEKWIEQQGNKGSGGHGKPTE